MPADEIGEAAKAAVVSAVGVQAVAQGKGLDGVAAAAEEAARELGMQAAHPGRLRHKSHKLKIPLRFCVHAAAAARASRKDATDEDIHAAAEDAAARVGLEGVEALGGAAHVCLPDPTAARPTVAQPNVSPPYPSTCPRPSATSSRR